MPELPDLEVMSRNLNKRLAGQTLSAISIGVAKKMNADAGELEKAVVNHKLKKIYREGKELRLAFNNDQVIGLHLMLHGEVKIAKTKEEIKFIIIKFIFSESLVLVLTDFQKNAVVTLNPVAAEVLDALNKKMDAQYLSALLSKRKAIVKNVLLDQHLIRGIGNAYADEIFYDSKISPLSISNKIPEKEVEKLVKSIQKVLTEAITVISKQDPDRITGENRDFMKVHLPKKEETAKGEKILMSKHGARKTYYVDSQKLYS